jgi:hypothetical protein
VVKRYHSIESGSFTYFVTSTPESPWTLVEGNVTDWALVRQVSFYQYDTPNLNAYIGSAVADAKRHALQHVDSTPYEFLEDLAEIGETISFLKSPLHSIKNLFSAYKRSRKKVKKYYENTPGTAEELKALADLWAQYRFALAPLIRSVMNAAEVLEKFDSIERPKRRTAHGWGKEFSLARVETYAPHKPYGPADTLVFDYTKVSDAEAEAHAAIYYEVSNPLVDWKFALGLRLKDIPVTMWEIVPLSFMVDRLINIKSMLTGLINLADPTVTILAGSVTTKRSERVNITLEDWFSSLGTLTVLMTKNDSVTFETFTYSRDLWDPAISDTLPRFTPGQLVKDVTSLLDLLAITTQIASAM